MANLVSHLFKAMVIFGIGSSAALATAAFRDPNGIQEALDACYRLTFTSDQQACAQVVQEARRQGRGFQLEAIRVCSRASFGTGAINCMRAIAGRTYLQSEINYCDRQSFDNERVRCMETSGVEDNGSYPDECTVDRQLVRMISDARLAVEQGRPRVASQILRRLEADLRYCP